MRILFTGGGTGGHIFPLVAVARQLKRMYSQTEPLELFYLGASIGSSRASLEQEGIRIKTILAGKMRRYFSLQNIVDLFKMPIGFLQSFWYLFIWMPDVIFSKGGYGSVPVVIIAWLYRIPVIIHESDAVPGLANKIASKFAKRIAVSFQKASQYFSEKKTALIGNPIRLELIQSCLSNNPEDIQKAKQIFNITTQKPVIFILGGSQGAQKINELISMVLIKLLVKYEVIHQAGQKNYEAIKKKMGKALPVDYHLFSFMNEQQMAGAYLLSNLIISRAGAGSIAEISACAKPSILIPLPQSAANHQKANAFAYAQAGASIILEQANLTPNLLLSQISKILDDQELAKKMVGNARGFSRPEASEKVAEALLEMGI